MTSTSSSAIKKLLLLFLVFAGLYYAKDFLIPLSIAGVLATLFLPFCKWMEEKKTPKWLAALICLLVLLLAISGIVTLLGLKIAELTNDITAIKEKALQIVNRIQEYIFDNAGIKAATQSQILKDGQPSFTGVIQTIAGSLASFFTNFILVMAYVFLLLYYRIHMRDFLLRLAQDSQQTEIKNLVSNTAKVSQQYLVGLAKMIVCLWIMYAIGFSIIGIENAIFFAVLCGLLEIVPFIGNLTGTAITLLAASVQGASLPMVAGIIGTYGVVQFIQGWALEPIIVGPQVKINPFSTIIALVLGQLLWGIAGIFLAIPLVAMFKIVCDNIESLKPYGFLMGEIKTTKKESPYLKKLKRSIQKITPEKFNNFFE